MLIIICFSQRLYGNLPCSPRQNLLASYVCVCMHVVGTCANVCTCVDKTLDCTVETQIRRAKQYPINIVHLLKKYLRKIEHLFTSD